MLKKNDLKLTPNRAAVLGIIGQSHAPQSALDILKRLEGKKRINRVTVYRILDLLVEKKLALRMSSGDRSFRYTLAGKSHGKPHPHFYCTRCGQMECLMGKNFLPGKRKLEKISSGRVEKVEVRLDGTCRKCLKAGPGK